MRKFFAVLVLAMSAIGIGAIAASASPTPLPVGVQGTYTYNQQGTKVTVGYSPCGYPTTNPDGTITFSGATPYFAQIQKSKSSTNVYAGSEGTLNSTLASYGVPLTSQASTVLENDAATLTCT